MSGALKILHFSFNSVRSAYCIPEFTDIFYIAGTVLLQSDSGRMKKEWNNTIEITIEHSVFLIL